MWQLVWPLVLQSLAFSSWMWDLRMGHGLEALDLVDLDESVLDSDDLEDYDLEDSKNPDSSGLELKTSENLEDFGQEGWPSCLFAGC